mgnify:CR=1 FL=1
MTRSTAGAGRRVLYVDPDDERATPVVDVLDEAGYVVERARDVAAAMDVVETDPPACVVSERRLPDASGLDLLRDVRARTDDLPFLIFTAVGDEHYASEAISAGVTDYIPREPAPKQRGALLDGIAAALAEGDRRFAAVTEELKDRAMDEAPVGITIADGKRRDTPLIYVNEAFEELSGYGEADVLGRNCNFMQGEASGEEQITEMAKAIDAGEPVSVELVNYTDDGDEFWNRVHIAPISDTEGEITHYVGFQEDVTERVEAEGEAQRQAEKARAERAKVEALLDRLDGLVTDVTSQLLGAETRAGVESAVTERLVETDEYALAWIGEEDPATNTITPGTWAGVADPPTLELSVGADDPVARAVQTGESQVVDASAVPTVYADALDGEPGGLAALPLQFGDVSYGVLVVVLRADATFSETEARVLSAVAQSTAMALQNLTSQRLLSSDDVIELEFSLAGEEPFFVGLSGELDAELVHAGTITRDDGPTTFFFETDADPDAVVTAAEQRPEILACVPVTTGEGRAVVEFTVEESPLVQLLLDRGGRITAMSASGGTGEMTVELPPEAQPRTVVEAVEDRVPGADLRAYREDEQPAERRQDVRASIEDRLTDRQSTALQTAIVGGFFEWPRETNGETLAEAMDIGRSTFHQHLRAAQRKVFEELYG